MRAVRRKLTKLYLKSKRNPTHGIRRLYLRKRAEAQKLLRGAYWNYINNLIQPPQEESNSPRSQKRFWSYIKSLRKDTTGISPLREMGSLHSAPQEKADILNRCYQSAFTVEGQGEIPDMGEQPLPSAPDITVGEEGVLNLLLKINPHKAAGPDKIPARILRECAVRISPLLTVIFQKSLDEGVVPKDWQNANVTAIFKKGDRSLASNYRPVSLTSLCCKLLEHIITSNVLCHLDQYSVLSDCQHGFRPRRSCETQLLTLSHELSLALDKRR